MPINLNAKIQAVRILASCDGVQMNGAFLAEDINALALALPSKQEFQSAIDNTYAALQLLASNSVDVAELTYSLAGWSAYHYQHRRGQGCPADMRIVFQRKDGAIAVLAIGHRNLPNSVYYAAAKRI